MSKYNLTDLLPEGTDAKYRDAKEADRLKKHPEGDKIKSIQAMMAKEKSMKEDKYDDIVDADDDISADKKKAAAMAYRKVDKGDSYEKATSHMKENYQMDGETYDRINGLVDQPLLNKFLGTFELIYDDFIEQGEEFEVDDIIDFLTICLDKHSKETRMEDQLPDGFNEGTPIPTEPGQTKIGDDGEEYGVRASNHDRKMAMRRVIDFLTITGHPSTGYKVSNDEALSFIKTHNEDIFSGDIDAYSIDDVWDNYDQFEAVNRPSESTIDESKRKDGKSSEDVVDEGLKEHFQRFLKDYQ